MLVWGRVPRVWKASTNRGQQGTQHPLTHNVPSALVLNTRFYRGVYTARQRHKGLLPKARPFRWSVLNLHHAIASPWLCPHTPISHFPFPFSSEEEDRFQGLCMEFYIHTLQS